MNTDPDTAPITMGVVTDGHERYADGTPWHPHYKNAEGFLFFTMEPQQYEGDHRRYVVHIDTKGFGGTAGVVHLDPTTGDYYGMRGSTHTVRRQSPQEVLEDLARVFMARPVPQQPSETARAALACAAKLMAERVKAFRRAEEISRNPHRTQVYKHADAALEGAFDVLAALLQADGVDVLGYGGFPSADLARSYLERWTKDHPNN